jgi:hypothetical protein
MIVGCQNDFREMGAPLGSTVNMPEHRLAQDVNKRFAWKALGAVASGYNTEAFWKFSHSII